MLPTSCPSLVVSFFFSKVKGVCLYFHSRTWELNHTLTCCFIVANNVGNDSYMARNALHAGNTIGISAKCIIRLFWYLQLSKAAIFQLS